MGKPVLSTPESEINCFAKLVDKQDCPRSSDIHYGLTMKYQVVEPLRSSSSSSSSSSSHPSPSTFHSFSPTSNFILVIHGAPECPRESYFKHSGTLEAFNIGDVHKLRLKRKLNRTPSPFDKLVDPYESDPCQRYISLRVEPASQPILRNRSIFETLRLALRGRSLQFRFDETTQEGMEDDPELGARGHGFHFQSQQRGRDNNNNSNNNEDNNNEEDDFDIRFFSSNRFDLAQMVQSILGRQISPPRSSLFGRDFAIGPLSLNEDLEDDNEDDDEDLEDEEQLREPLVGLDPMDDEDLSLFEGDDDEEDEEYDEEQDQGDEYDDDDDHGHAMDEEEEEELHPPRQLFSSLVHRQISLDDDSEDEAEDDEYDEERDESHGSRRAEDQNRRREGGGGAGGNGPQSASQRSYPYFHSTYF